MDGLASFNCSQEVSALRIPLTNKGRNRREEEHSLFPLECHLSLEKHHHQTEQICCQSKIKSS